MKNTDAYIWCCGMLLLCFLLSSCSEDASVPEIKNHQITNKENQTAKNAENYILKHEPISYSLSDRFQDEELILETCESTPFSEVLSNYFEDLLNDPVFEFNLLNYYLELNQKYVTYYIGENWYGENGEFNKLAERRMRELRRFWNIDRDIYLNGQHTSYLNDREILADMIESFDRTIRNRTEAYQKADLLLEINQISPNFPENPYFAFDAFTKKSGLLVIGDGLIQSITDTGIEAELAFTAILSHEWWHQAQFQYEDHWETIGDLTEQSEISRFSELEADYAASYFLTHKRGATYNWKRIEEYFELSFNVGDCLTESTDHHGTPSQRLTAAKLGYELADAAQKKGSILTATEVHLAFLKDFSNIIE